MIDWVEKVKNLKEMGEELDLWASRSTHRQKVVLGVIADELRRFAKELDEEMVGNTGRVKHSEDWREELMNDED